jgi:hypothetical protein
MWYDPYFEGHKLIDEAMWHNFRRFSYGDVLEALKRAEEHLCQDKENKIYLPYLEVFMPKRTCCVHCKNFRLHHIYGHATCVEGVLKSIFSPTGTCCPKLDEYPKSEIENIEIEYILDGVFHMYYELVMDYMVSHSDLKKLYNWWKKSDEAKEYIDGYWEKKRGGGTGEC